MIKFFFLITCSAVIISNSFALNLLQSEIPISGKLSTKSIWEINHEKEDDILLEIEQAIVAFGDIENAQYVKIKGHANLSAKDCRNVTLKLKNICTTLDLSEANFLDNELPGIYGVFEGFASLETVILPDSILSIGSYSFYDCENLKNINLPESVESIEAYAFYNCYKLNLKRLPPKLAIINVGSFQNCENITISEIPENVEYISKKAFYGCFKIEKMFFPYKLDSIGDYAFYGCQKMDVTQLPNRLKKIGNSAFVNCYNLIVSKFPTELISIGDNAFEKCISLKNIEFPVSLKKIGNVAFRGCDFLNSVKCLGYLPIESGLGVFTIQNPSKVALYIHGDTYSYYSTNDTWKNMDIRIFSEGVSIYRDTICLTTENTEIIEATVFPENAYNKKISWQIGDPNIANINSSGLITAKNAGSTFVVAKSADSEERDTCMVVVSSNLSIEKFEKSNKNGKVFTIYPNPIDNEFTTIYLKNNKKAIVSIFDLKGTLIYNKEINSAMYTIDFLHSGIYWVKVEKDYYTQMEKIIVL